uniref:Uncharacterized protein n=1 Tax=Anguilla anguilla TaxID=7936 RepID=A0A0E9VPT8_ANGAN
MAGIILTRFISRSLLPASKHVKTKGLTRQYWTPRRKPLLTVNENLLNFFLLNCLSCCSNFAVLCVSQL